MPFRFLIALPLAAAALAAASPAFAASPPEGGLAERYRDAAGRLIGAAMVSDVGYDRLAWLCDRIGHRLSGSPQLERAVEWSLAEMKKDGFANVRGEPVMVPHWVRGDESARVIEPAEHRLNILGLGNSIGTPPEGITAEVVVVGSFEELEALGEAVRGKIVLYDVPFDGYGKTVRFRGRGASAAAKQGAVAALVRSVGPMSYDTPHTGMLRYEDGVPQIPAAAVTIEAATMLRRMAERGERIVVALKMEAHFLPDAESANVVAEVRGSELPEEIVVVAGHLDSWDVGQGAQDDGVGCLIAWEAARLIQELGLKPRRTIRVVLYTNEENGLRGGRQYLEDHRGELSRHVAALESDAGNGLASGFWFDVNAQVPPNAGAADSADAKTMADAATEHARTLLHDIARLLEPLDAAKMEFGGSGADIGPIVEQGVTGLGLAHDSSHYFDIHHTHADTFDRIVKNDMKRNTAVMAVMAFVLADMPGRLVPEGMLHGVMSAE